MAEVINRLVIITIPRSTVTVILNVDSRKRGMQYPIAPDYVRRTHMNYNYNLNLWHASASYTQPATYNGPPWDRRNELTY